MSIAVNEHNFKKEVLESLKPVLVEIRANWCGACHIMAPMIAKLSTEYGGQIKFVTLDIESEERLMKEYRISELPVLLFFKMGKLVDHVIGTTSKRMIDEKLNRLLDERSVV